MHSTTTRTLLTALFASSLAGASFVEPIVTFEESDARVQCSPAPGALTCAGLENCQHTDSWWAVDGNDYHGGRMVAIDSPASCRVEFQGTSITFYGLRIENGANGTYAVDGGERKPFTWGITNERLGSGVTGIFRATGLRFGKHVLEFTADAVKGKLASVDFFAVTDPSLEKDVPQPSRPGGFVVTHNFVPGAQPTIPPIPPIAPIAPVAPIAPIAPVPPVEHLEHIAVPESAPSDDFFSDCSPFVIGVVGLLAVVLGAGVLFTVSRRVRRLVRRGRGRRNRREVEERTEVAEEEGKPLLKE